MKNPARCKVKLTCHPPRVLRSIHDTEMTSSASGRLCHVSAVILLCSQRVQGRLVKITLNDADRNSLRERPCPLFTRLERERERVKKRPYEYTYEGGYVRQAMCWRWPFSEHTVRTWSPQHPIHFGIPLYMRQHLVSGPLNEKCSALYLPLSFFLLLCFWRNFFLNGCWWTFGILSVKTISKTKIFGVHFLLDLLYETNGTTSKRRNRFSIKIPTNNSTSLHVSDAGAEKELHMFLDLQCPFAHFYRNHISEMAWDTEQLSKTNGG